MFVLSIEPKKSSLLIFTTPVTLEIPFLQLNEKDAYTGNRIQELLIYKVNTFPLSYLGQQPVSTQIAILTCSKLAANLALQDCKLAASSASSA